LVAFSVPISRAVCLCPSIQHTVRYTELAADRFKGFWQD
jgi:hypothetical protein